MNSVNNLVINVEKRVLEAKPESVDLEDLQLFEKPK